MKKIIQIIMFMVLFSACIAFADTGTSIIKVTMINQEPDPVAPGNMVDVRFRIENSGTAPLQDVQVKLVLNSGILYYDTEPEIREIGTVTGGQTGDIGVRQNFKLLVDNSAATGPNKIEFWYKVKNMQWVKAGDYTLTVRQRESAVAINQVLTDSNIAPGSTTKVSFRVENMADSNLRNLKLELDLLMPLVTSASVSYRELPFTPVDSGNEKTVRLLESQKFVDINFNLFTDATAESKIYKVPYTLSYTDDYGANFTSQGIVGLLVSSKPDISTTVDSSSIYSAGTSGRVTVKIVNKGFTNLKFINAKLADSEDYDILSSPSVYIGKLDSDDYETADFTIVARKATGGTLSLPLTLEYKDANGKPYTEITTLKLHLNPDLKPNSGSGSAIIWILLIVIIAAGLFIFLRRRKNKR